MNIRNYKTLNMIVAGAAVAAALVCGGCGNKGKGYQFELKIDPNKEGPYNFIDLDRNRLKKISQEEMDRMEKTSIDKGINLIKELIEEGGYDLVIGPSLGPIYSANEGLFPGGKKGDYIKFIGEEFERGGKATKIGGVYEVRTLEGVIYHFRVDSPKKGQGIVISVIPTS